MKQILILGAGKIGSLVAHLLAETHDYQVYLGDRNINRPKKVQQIHHLPNLEVVDMDVEAGDQLEAFLKNQEIGAILSCLPYYCNVAVAQLAKQYGLHYFDLTEDVSVTRAVKDLAKDAKQAFVPQCGLAPGFISIVANNLIQDFAEIDTVKMRVGALPVHPSNVLKYSLTWSTDGLINEYGNLCYGIENGKEVTLMPLEGYETIEIDGLLYEAFNTSGGLGTLADSYDGKVKTMNYKTLRYPGHCEKVHLLMVDLKLNEDRDTLKRILENAVPKTLQDVVIIFVSVAGLIDGEYYEKNFVKKIYPQQIVDKTWSAIQVTTAAGLCGVVDLVMQNPEQYHGFITQECIDLQAFLSNRFGQYYA